MFLTFEILLINIYLHLFNLRHLLQMGDLKLNEDSRMDELLFKSPSPFSSYDGYFFVCQLGQTIVPSSLDKYKHRHSVKVFFKYVISI